MKELFVSNNDWDSHLPMLEVALNNTTGRVVEIGIGFGSTPKLSWRCYEQKRIFHAWETNKDWYENENLINKASGDTTSIGWCSDYFLNHYLDSSVEDCGLLFVDCAPGEIRKDIIAKYANDAKVIVVHDSEIGASYVYGLEPTLSTFKYRKDYKPEGKPHTTAVSNFIDVSKWQL